MYNDALLAGSGGSLMISWLCYSGSLVSDGSAVGETDTVGEFTALNQQVTPTHRGS